MAADKVSRRHSFSGLRRWRGRKPEAVPEQIADGRFTSIDGQDRSQPLPYDASLPVAEQVKQSVARSLQNLRVDRIDSVLLHSPMRKRDVSGPSRLSITRPRAKLLGVDPELTPGYADRAPDARDVRRGRHRRPARHLEHLRRGLPPRAAGCGVCDQDGPEQVVRGQRVGLGR